MSFNIFFNPGRTWTPLGNAHHGVWIVVMAESPWWLWASIFLSSRYEGQHHQQLNAGKHPRECTWLLKAMGLMCRPNQPWIEIFWKRKLHLSDRAREMVQWVKAPAEKTPGPVYECPESIQKGLEFWSVAWASAMSEFLCSYGKWKQENLRTTSSISKRKSVRDRQTDRHSRLKDWHLSLSSDFCVHAKVYIHLPSYIHTYMHSWLS